MNLPPLELLKEVHDFPGLYTFKAIGGPEDIFLGSVLKRLAEVLGESGRFQHAVRESAKGKYQAVTLEVRVDSAERVHEIYHSLITVPGLRMLL